MKQAAPAELPPTWKLSHQLWLALLIPIAVALGLYGVAAHQNRQRVLMSEASAELRNHATLVEAAVGNAVEHGQMDALTQRIERLAQADRILGIAAFEVPGGPIFVTDHIADATPELAALAERASHGGDGLEEEREVAGGPALVRTVAFSPMPGRPAVVAIVVRDLRYLDALASSLNRWLVVTGAALLAVTAAIAAIASRITVGRPAGNIVAGVERVAAGDLATKVPEQGAEELIRLAQAFNAMTSSLAEARARAEREEAARIAEEAARAAVERKLQHTQALAAVGQVAASIGHEIGSPLNVILGRARRAADQPGCPEPLRRELETIATQSERISRVVARLLAVSRPPQSVGKGSELVQVVREALAFLRPECRQRRVRTRFDQHEATPRVALDADRLFQIVFNLCLNALQAQPDGGEIVLRTIAHEGRWEEERKVALEVEDRGPGVPREIADHIFDAFFTSRGDRGGTGLGLAIVSGIVREAGGTVELVPAALGGACFRVVLPADVPRSALDLVEARS